MQNLLEKQVKFNGFIEQTILKNNKISHAYLIEVTNVKNYMDIIKEFIKKILVQKYSDNIEMIKKISIQIDTNNYPDIKIIKPDGFWIKKDQLLNLEEDFSKTSMLDNKLIYIIDKAENLNDFAANTILKFLEEPPENIVAILLTNNKYRVLETIVSRCQNIKLEKDKEIVIDETINNFAEDIIEQKDLIIYFDKYLTNLFNDRELAQSNLNSLENYFSFLLEQESANKKNQDMQITNNKILKYIDIIIDFKEKLQYNINLKLWLTNLLVKLMEVV